MGVMRAIASWGLPVSDDLQVFTALEQVIDHYRGIERRRADLPFDIDGVVYKVNRLNRSEEHTSELQSLMRRSYAVFCLKKKIENTNQPTPFSRLCTRLTTNQ